ncbi:MAG: hypothetical protein Q7K45_04860 [Nanoarchaeota archaeon]|nr:hypothetical protein [Nanoarchaeota archaeon]
MNIAFTMAVIFLFAWILSKISRMQRKEIIMIKMMMDFNHKLETTLALNNDREKLMDWRWTHPEEPMNEDEKLELETLMFNYMGSYLIYCAVNDAHFDARFVDRAWDCIRDWRY